MTKYASKSFSFAALGLSIALFSIAAQAAETSPSSAPTVAAEEQKAKPEAVRKLRARVGVRGSLDKLKAATVTVLPKRGLSTETNADGVFEIEIPANAEALLIQKEGYLPLEYRLEQPSAQTLSQSAGGDSSTTPSVEDLGKINLEPSADLLGVGVIRARRKVEVSQQSLTRSEILRVPGTRGDAVSALQTLPSVLPVFPGAANVVVRGSAPEDTKSFYDRLELPFVFHLGGLGTVIPTRALEGIDFYPGGFSSLYNDAIGATIQLRSENKVPARTGGEFELGLLQSAAYLETPTQTFSETPVGVRAGFRRSYIELLVPLIKKVGGSRLQRFTVPQITDYQLILNGTHSKGTWQGYLVGAADRLSLVVPSGQANNSEGTAQFSLFNYFEVMGLRYSLNLGDGWGLTLVPQQRLVIINQDIFDNTVDVRGNRLGLDVVVDKKFNEQWSGSMGVRPEFDRTTSKVSAIQLPPTGFTPFFDPDSASKTSSDVKRETTTLQAHLDVVWKPTDELMLNPGVAFLQGNRSVQRAADPRFATRWQLIPGTALKGAVGTYSQRPGPQFDAPDYGNPNLTLERARHLVFGIEQNVIEDLDADLQFYQKKMWHLVGQATADRALRYENNIEGRAYGAEILIRKARKGRWNGWLSYGWSHSERKDPALFVWRNFDFDRPHSVNVVGSYRVTGQWELSARWQYLSGGPFNIIEGSIFNQNTGRYRALSSSPTPVLNINNGRNPAFAQLDVRTDYDFRMSDWTLSTYFELLNATNRENVQGYRYSPDYRSREEVLGTPLIPSFGIKAVF
ncbi:hypothetical protein EBU99_04900 [bacterium]|nr:hypothetical protein [bacterium]